MRALLDRATGGERIQRRSRLSPSLVDKVLRDPFWVWCQYHAPPGEAVNEVGRYQQMRYRRGVEHEDAWVAAHYPDALAIKPDFGYEALTRTLRAMLDGVPAIHQPQLWDLGRDVYGRGDLLVRDDGHGSDLGPLSLPGHRDKAGAQSQGRGSRSRQPFTTAPSAPSRATRRAT